MERNGGRISAHPLENKFVFIQPSGEIAWQYLKARPIPGPEAAVSVKSDGVLRHFDTPYRQLSAPFVMTRISRD
jgi:hypothetical protein